MVDVTANERWKETYVAIQETLVDLIDDILVYRRTEGKPVHAAEIMSPSERMADSKAQARARATLLGEEEPTSPDAR